MQRWQSLAARSVLKLTVQLSQSKSEIDLIEYLVDNIYLLECNLGRVGPKNIRKLADAGIDMYVLPTKISAYHTLIQGGNSSKSHLRIHTKENAIYHAV